MSVSFPDLVRLHFDWQREVRANGSAAARARELEGSYRQALASFESEHGRVVNAYWCTEEPSAVALTDRLASGLRGWPPFRWFARPALRFHRVSDWATRHRPDVAASLQECDELAIKISEVLTGKRLRIGHAARHVLGRPSAQSRGGEGRLEHS